MCERKEGVGSMGLSVWAGEGSVCRGWEWCVEEGCRGVCVCVEVCVCVGVCVGDAVYRNFRLTIFSTAGCKSVKTEALASVPPVVF